MRSKLKTPVYVLLALAVLVAACGGDDGGDGDEQGARRETTTTEGTPRELTPISVGILPIAALAPMHYGVEQGYFEEEGLEINMEVGQGGAALTPSVVSGQYQFAFGNYISLMLAHEANAGLRVVSNIANGADSAEGGTDALLVAPDSGIESVDDLAGKTIAVAGLNGIEEVALRAVLDENDVDDSDIDFTEVPFPEMNAALESGAVDVAAQVEPFVTLGQDAGLVRLLDPIYEAVPSMPLGIVFASEDWLQDNPELAEAFYRALQRSLEAASDEQAMRETIAATTETPPEVAEQMALDNWEPEIDREALGVVAELATRYGILEAEPDIDELIWTPE